ncbi:MAG: DUF1246 domain-containing protein, partial [bacterium]|nr:DUF1246 domain-containing protein [bacterium]
MKFLTDPVIGVLGSHSALEVCRGAKDQGFSTLVIAEKGREKTYRKYFITEDGLGCVDECLVVDKFSELLSVSMQKELRARNVIFVPHRSFEVYLNFDYEEIEKRFKVPIFGNRFLLKIEDRGVKPNQYDLLEKAGIRFPKQFKNPSKIDRLCLVKVLEKERGFERAFFLVKNSDDFSKQAEKKIKEGAFTGKQLKEAVIEEFVMGVHVNFNYFYSPLKKRLELLGTDTRRQTNIEGLQKLPAVYQREVLLNLEIKYEEAGHIAVTILESMLENVFEIGERFLRASQKMFPPGIIG